MITVEIPEEVAVKLLMDRVREYIDLEFGAEEVWQKFYTQRVEQGFYTKLDPKTIVDNDEQRYFTVREADLASECDVHDIHDDRIVATNGTWFLVDMKT